MPDCRLKAEENDRFPEKNGWPHREIRETAVGVKMGR
jgi:hypothetical protein